MQACNLNDTIVSTYRNYKFIFCFSFNVSIKHMKNYLKTLLIINTHISLHIHRTQIQGRIDYTGNAVDT